jgi:hypothetical protein
MNKIIAGIVLCMMLFVSPSGFIITTNTAVKLTPDEPFEDYSHNILGEFGTRSGCKYCGMANAALKNIYAAGWHPFYYTTLVCAKNAHAEERGEDELGISSYPTVFFDGGFRKDIGATSIPNAMSRYNTSIITCGNRNVANIDLSVDVEWLGAVNPDPEDGATNVHIEPTLQWNLTAMNINVTIENNEPIQYDGHLHVYVAEAESQYWLDYYHLPYTMAFLDYAWNEDVEISADSSWNDSMEWDGCDFDNGLFDDDKIIFDDIFQDNTMVVASVFNANTNYSDETTGTLAGVDTFPKTHDIYFGNTTPPPLVVNNQSSLTYSPSLLPWNTTYYWKVVTWDNQDNKAESPIYSFTTRDNHAPNIPSNPFPPNNSNNVPIKLNMSWSGGDPDNDTVYYDVYFGPIFPPNKVESNQTETYYMPGLLQFNTSYYWKIVAWDRYGLSSISENWNFLTQENLPPNMPTDPNPSDGANDVPIQANLSWVGGDPNQGDSITYEIYFEEGNQDPQELIDIVGPYNATQDIIIYDIDEDLVILHTYYWKIISIDSKGLKNEGKVWSFSTGENFPPSKPLISGQKEGKAGEDYEYTFKSVDPEGANVSYYITWGDGSGTGWIGPYPSGEAIVLSYNWSRGTYTIKAKARDQYYQESGETIYKITMPKNKPFVSSFPLLNWLFEQFPNMFPILRYIVGLS